MQQGFRAQRDKTPFDKLAQAFARTRLGGWLFVNVFPVIDRRLIPLTGGRLAVAVGQPMLLLHTRGARSGQPRSTPLLYTRHGRGYVVVASKAGADHHPGLVLQPARIRVRSRSRSGAAHRGPPARGRRRRA
jgi:deazaflavin-dependent oxidoreductase (nitroreductase family)